ncbi:hypothetical protein [Dyella sp. A6]|uniref:hypothetical protein n=1 Tax=Dyella aluminiiresistens TaxID=3069105 RepID=UPI002E7705B2|nr:hypothetical protein [Dyella sp. A6]
MTRHMTTKAAIAIAGLDILPATRLKVACNLLAAERLDVSVMPWGTSPADILVADTTSVDGRSAASSALSTKLPLLTFNRVTSIGPASSMSLPLNATVRDIATALKQLIAIVSVSGTKARKLLPPLLQALDRSRLANGIMTFARGTTSFIVDQGAGLVLLSDPAAMEDIVTHSMADDWTSKALDTRACNTRLTEQAYNTVTIESLWWRIVTHETFALPKGDDARPVQLSAWPELDAHYCPPQWLPAIAQLMYSGSTADSLARTTGIDPADATRLIQVAHLSGLTVTTPSRHNVHSLAGKATLTHSFMNVAKRFGLKLFGRQHG